MFDFGALCIRFGEPIDPALLLIPHFRVCAAHMGFPKCQTPAIRCWSLGPSAHDPSGLRDSCWESRWRTKFKNASLSGFDPDALRSVELHCCENGIWGETWLLMVWVLDSCSVLSGCLLRLLSTASWSSSEFELFVFFDRLGSLVTAEVRFSIRRLDLRRPLCFNQVVKIHQIQTSWIELELRWITKQGGWSKLRLHCWGWPSKSAKVYWKAKVECCLWQWQSSVLNQWIAMGLQVLGCCQGYLGSQTWKWCCTVFWKRVFGP